MQHFLYGTVLPSALLVRFLCPDSLGHVLRECGDTEATDTSSSEQAECKEVKRQKLPDESQEETAPERESKFEVGDAVIISGLSKARYNGCKGRVSSAEKDGRYGVKVTLESEVKRLGLKSVNLSLVSKAKPARVATGVTGSSNSTSASPSANASGGGRSGVTTSQGSSTKPAGSNWRELIKIKLRDLAKLLRNMLAHPKDRGISNPNYLNNPDNLL